QANTAIPGDSNGDGLPDAWQIQFFGSITLPNAAPSADPDNDGFINLQEYLAGTNPTNAASFLKLDSIDVSANSASIHFTAVAGKPYTLLYTDDLRGSWLK